VVTQKLRGKGDRSKVRRGLRVTVGENETECVGPSAATQAGKKVLEAPQGARKIGILKEHRKSPALQVGSCAKRAAGSKLDFLGQDEGK